MLIGIVRELSLNVLEILVDKYIDNKKTKKQKPYKDYVK